MHNTAIVRLVDDRLAWYPPGASAEPQWLDNSSAAEDLRAVLSQRRLKVCFASPGADTRLLSLAVTAAEKKHIGKSLPFTLEEQVASDIDDLHFASCDLDKDNLAIAVCAHPKMAQWRELLADFPGITRWSPEPLLLPWQEDEWCLVLEGDNAVVRVDRGVGFSVERAMAPALLHSVAVEREPRDIIIYGSDQDADVALLPESLRQRVQWRKGNFYSALMLSDASATNLNLLQGHFAPRLPMGRWWRQWRMVATVFVAVFVLQLAADYADYRSLLAENRGLRAAVQDSYRKAYPRGAVVDAEKQLKRQLDALQGTAQSSGFTSLMQRVGSVISAMPGASIASINYSDKGNEMRMNVVANDFASVERLRSRMSDAGLDVVMESSSAQGKRVRARLRVGRRS